MSGRFAAIGRAVQETLTQCKGKPVLMNFDGATAVILVELGFAGPLARGLFLLLALGWGHHPCLGADAARRAQQGTDADRLDTLARLYRAQGLYAKAEPLLIRSLGIDEKLSDPTIGTSPPASTT